jgi:hypothetical protein
MDFPASQIGLPNSLNYQLPPSLPDSAKTSTVHLAPDGLTEVVSANFTGNAFVANNSGDFGLFNSQVVSFTIPSGNGIGTFIDPMSTCLSFTLSYQVTTAPTGLTGGSLNLIGSASSFFDQLILYSNNVPLETIGNYGLLQNYLLANMVSNSERNGGFSVSMGCDTNSMTGIELGTAVATYRYSFNIPLCSIIGYNSDKLFPIGSINNLQLQMVTAQNLPLVSFCTAVTTQPAFSGGFRLSEFQLNLKYLDVGDVASRLLADSLNNGKWFMRSTTYTNSAVTIPAQSSGNAQLLLQIRNSSVKSVLQYFCTARSAACPNFFFDAINPSLNSRQLQIGSQYIPNKPINDCQRPAEGYAYLIQALTSGGGLAKSAGSGVFRDTYNMCLPSVPANSDNSLVTPAAGVRATPAGADSAAANVTKYPNSAYYGYDLEKSSGILLSGINTRSTPPFLNINFAQSIGTLTVVAQAWGMSDVILVFDIPSRSVQAYI